MKTLNSISRTTTLLMILSAMYAILDMNIIYLAPIVTIILPYRFMQEKDETKVKENRKILNNLFLFNMATFAGTMLITDKSSLPVVEVMTNILITFIYYKILGSMEKKREALLENPEAEYEKINQRISALEIIYIKAKEDMENEENEKRKSSSKAKVEALKMKIDQAKQQLDYIEKQIELKNNNQH
ncbi:MAG: hypothetical protein ACRC92_17150 [Peptostreptococcaceae bacterium]